MPIFQQNADKRYKQAARKLAEGQIEEAIEQLDSLLEDEPNHHNALVTLAISLLEVQENLDKCDQRTVRAFELLDMAAELNPEDPVPIFNKAVCLRKLGLLDDALATFEEVLSLEERHTLSILHMAEINYELQRWEKAVDLARLALIRDPGIEDALFWVKDAMIKGGIIEDDLNLAKDKLPSRPPSG